ncbi:MAG TPA: YciI family protein [Acidimicrobiales bacterium]|jgi:hypothetical protein|nr:YciI family protein [Acidimicrobiales bacterium]
MKYMLLIYSDPSVYADAAVGQKIMEEYGTFTQAIVDSGELVSGEPLQGSDTATVVRSRAGQISTTDGPYVETKEYLAGYYVVDVKDLDRAIEIAAMIPDARTAGIEVRPVMDFPG